MSRSSISGKPFSINSAPIRPTQSSKQFLPHFDDLVARCDLSAHQNEHASIQSWLEKAEDHWRQFQAARTFGHSPDRAFVEFLMTYTIVTKMIPHNKEYPSLRSRHNLNARYRHLQDELLSRNDEVNRLKEDIRRNNAETGVQSAKSLQEADSQKSQKPLQNGTATIKPTIAKKPTSLSSRPLSPVNRGRFDGADGSASRGSYEFSPKPSNKDVDDLWSRLNALKPSDKPPPTNGIKDGKNGSSESTYASKGFSKVNGSEPDLPTPPVPAYSLGKSATPIGVGYISPPGYSTPSAPPTDSALEGPDRVESPVAHSQPMYPDSLYQYLTSLSTKVSILFIDLRNREKYDAGHIPGDSVCIEHISLHDGMTAEEIEERLFILTTDKNEEVYFRNRDVYDVVVMYDQSTSDPDYMKSVHISENRSLRQLTQALTVYSYRTKLKSPPFFLVGGFDGWTKQVNWNKSFIKTSHTSATMHMYEREEVLDPYQRAQIEFPDLEDHGSQPSPTKSEKWLDTFQETTDAKTFGVPKNEDGFDIRRQRRNLSIVSNPDITVNRNVAEFFSQLPTAPRERESMISPRQDFYDSPSNSPSVYRNTNINNPFYAFNDSRHQRAPSSPSRPPPVATRQSYSGVAERLPNRLTNEPVILTNRDTSTGSRAIFATTFLPADRGTVTVGQVGLKNLGNTCYMNSILQCLSGTAPLSRYFLDGSFKHHINAENPLGSRGVLCAAFSGVIKELWMGKEKFVSPGTFKNVSGRLNETFSSDDQQDAMEFLEFFLDGLHEDLNTFATKPKLRELSEKEERTREQMPIQRVSILEWKRYELRNQSIIVDWFQGQLSSRLRCLTCNTTSTTYNAFTFLSVPIPRKSKVTLQDCLDEFLKEETLEKEDAWQCPQCKTPRRATKKLTITRLPQILVVHFKRFASKERWQNKIGVPIEYPIMDWDLTPYIPPCLPEENLPENEQGCQQHPPFAYNLYAVCNHYGTLNGGHYTAFVHNSYTRSWNCHDDSRTTPMHEEDVLSREAYLLFYVRIGSQ